MMFSEFVEGTGCKDNEFNRELFKKFEEIYMMNDSFTKAQIYEAAKPFCNNEKSPEEIEAEEKVKEEIAEYEAWISENELRIERYRCYVECSTDKEEIKTYREEVKRCKAENKHFRGQIVSLKHFFNV